MLILHRRGVERLTNTGTVDRWSPLRAKPAMNVIHVVRMRRDGETITRAKPIGLREAVLQDLTYPEALQAGFKTRDDFYAWWEKRFATEPLSSGPVACWVVTYERVALEPLRYLTHGRPKISDEYTQNHIRAIDDAACVPESVQKKFALEGWQGFAKRQAERAVWDGLRPLSERLRELERLQATGVDVGKQMGRIRAAVEAAERRARMDAA